GGFAEFCVAPAGNVYPVPDGAPWEEAAAFPSVYATAYRAVLGAGALRRGEWLLVRGAGGGLSTAAVQLAVDAGARVVVSSTSAARLARARELGAEAVVDGDGDPDVAAEVHRITGGGAHVV